MDSASIRMLEALSGPPALIILSLAAIFAVWGRARGRTQQILPSQRTQTGRRTARKTAALRVLLVLLLIPYAVGTALLLPRDVAEERMSEGLPSASSGIFVVDVSGSISERNKAMIRNLFEEAAEKKLHIGLVLFAGDSYVLWGPNVPAEEVAGKMAEFFTPNEGSGNSRAVSVWNIGGGTEMIEGMLDAQAMREMLIARGAESVPIILISDLQDYQQSRRDSLRLLGELKLQGEEVYIVDLNLTKTRFNSAVSQPYRDVVGRDAFITDLTPLEPIEDDSAPAESVVPARVGVSVFAGLSAILLLIVLADVFLLPRLPLSKRRNTREREEE